MTSARILSTSLISLLAITGCSSPIDPLDDLLNQPAASEVEIPANVAQLSSALTSTLRMVGEDREGYVHYVGESENNDICLIAVRAETHWGSTCGTPGYFTIEMEGIRASLIGGATTLSSADEVVGGVVLINYQE